MSIIVLVSLWRVPTLKSTLTIQEYFERALTERYSGNKASNMVVDEERFTLVANQKPIKPVVNKRLSKPVAVGKRSASEAVVVEKGSAPEAVGDETSDFLRAVVEEKKSIAYGLAEEKRLALMAMLRKEASGDDGLVEGTLLAPAAVVDEKLPTPKAVVDEKPVKLKVVVEEKLSHAEPVYGKSAKGYVTFESYPGRFGNQVWQFDWAYRVAKLLNRTLILPTWNTFGQYIGFPNMNKLNHVTLWDMEYINATLNPRKAEVEVIYEVDAFDRGLIKPVQDLPFACVWNDSHRLLAHWALNAAKQGCDEQIHFKSGTGLLGPYRTDTRSFGIDPGLFFKSLRIKSWIEQDINAMMDRAFQTHMSNSSGSNSVLGMHVRSWERERKNKRPDDPSLRICVPHTAFVLNRIKDHARYIHNKCGCDVESVRFPGRPWNKSMLDDVWTKNHLSSTCTLYLPESVALVTGRSLDELKNNKFVLAIDHENATLDRYFHDLGGVYLDSRPILKRFYENIGESPGSFNDTEPNRVAYLFDQALQREDDIKFELLRMKRYNHNLFPVLVDLVSLSKADFFVGLPSSSLSRHICMWRRSIYNKMNDYCVLMDLLTISNSCFDYDEISCASGKVLI